MRARIGLCRSPAALLAGGAASLVLILGEARGEEHEAPSPNPLRYNEDWRFLGKERRSEGAKSLKHLSIDREGTWRASSGAEFRVRHEFYGNPNWGDDTQDDGGYLWTRALPFVDLYSDDFRSRAFVELNIVESAGVGEGPSPVDEDRGDFLQLFADLGEAYLDGPGGDDGARLRVGRQVLALGSQRLVGTRYGVNVIRSFDSLEATLRRDGWYTRALYARPTEVEIGDFDNEPSSDQQLWGVYSTVETPDGIGLDLYYLGFVDDLAVFQQTAGREVRHTIGARQFGRVDDWFWNAEVAAQFGTVAEADIGAWTLALEGGRVLRRLPFTPRFDLKLDLISGDRDNSDGTVGTFNPLFPSLKYFGESGVLAPYNLIDFHPTLTVDVNEWVQIGADVDFLWRFSTDDAVYGAGGGILRDGSLSDARYVATQYEVFFEVELRENVAVFVSWTTLPPGSFLIDSGESETIHFVASELTWAF